MSRGQLYLKLVLLALAAAVLTIAFGGEPWGPN